MGRIKKETYFLDPNQNFTFKTTHREGLIFKISRMEDFTFENHPGQHFTFQNTNLQKTCSWEFMFGSLWITQIIQDTKNMSIQSELICLKMLVVISGLVRNFLIKWHIINYLFGYWFNDQIWISLPIIKQNTN